MDVAPVLSTRALILYLAKYVSKSETKSNSLDEVLTQISGNSNKSANSLIQRLYIKACSDRDYSAQEGGHVIMKTPFYSSSRSCVHIYLHEDSDWTSLEKETSRGRSLVEKYEDRDQEHNDKSVWLMAKWYNLNNNRKRMKETVTFQPQKQNEKFFRIQVLLHVPWRNIRDFTDQNCTWEYIYRQNINRIEGQNQLLLMGNVEMEEEDQNMIDDDHDSYLDKNIEDYMALSAMGPHQVTTKVSLGHRYIDNSYDWNAAFNKYIQNGTIEELQCFVAKEKGKASICYNVPLYPDEEFAEEQKSILNLVDKQIQQSLDGVTNTYNQVPKSVIVQGSAGTGKSLIIKALTHKVLTKLGMDKILLLAPTGVAAININGSTAQSRLRFVKMHEFVELEGTTARKFCNDLKGVKFIVFDEYSMMGCGMMGMIDRRLKQATGNYTEDFGGLYVYFFGDVYQLPPFYDTPLFSNKVPKHSIAKHGQFVWQNITCSVIVKKIHRQADEQFKSVLNNICKGEVTENDYKTLSTRFTTNLTYDDRRTFDSAIRVSGYKFEVEKTNLDKLSQLKFFNGDPVPVSEIHAKHNCQEAEMGSSDEASGLMKTSVLGPSCKIMLRTNLWTEMGLVNGAVGTLIDLICLPNERPPDNMPALLICSFENYKGPYLGGDKLLKLVPIPAFGKSWTSSNGTKCTRVQFPVQTAFAITIHKSQGLTLTRIVIDINEKKEVAAGATFVALSRARSLEGILLEPFSKTRFLKL